MKQPEKPVLTKIKSAEKGFFDMNSYIKNYPRPQLVRPAWTNLNGTWKFQFDDHDKGETEKWYETFPEKTLQIEVPFTYETKRSGIEDTAHHAQV